MFKLISTLSINELVWRDGLVYKKFSNEPFTGNVWGKSIGTIKDGKQDGLFEVYRENGHLYSRGTYKNGKLDGIHEWYDKEGILEKRTTYKNGEIVEWNGSPHFLQYYR